MILGLIQVKKCWPNDWFKAILIPEKLEDLHGKSSRDPEAFGPGAQCPPAPSLLDPYGTQLHRLDQILNARAPTRRPGRSQSAGRPGWPCHSGGEGENEW